jgi:hypothetical protein
VVWTSFVVRLTVPSPKRTRISGGGYRSQDFRGKRWSPRPGGGESSRPCSLASVWSPLDDRLRHSEWQLLALLHRPLCHKRLPEYHLGKSVRAPLCCSVERLPLSEIPSRLSYSPSAQSLRRLWRALESVVLYTGYDCVCTEIHQ